MVQVVVAFFDVDGSSKACDLPNLCVTCAGSRTGGMQQHIVEEHRSMYIALCQEAKSLGRAISEHKQVASRVALSSDMGCGTRVKHSACVT
jgi:hypothetical protein